MPKFKLMNGDCVDMMKQLEDNSVDSICCDPPYGLGFMGKKWDVGVPAVDVFAECLRVLKPGGHLLAFGGSRTYHRMAVAVEDAGFEIRDQIMWVYSTGFPKSHNVGKAVDKLRGNEREVVCEGKPMASLGTMHDDNWESNPNYKQTKGTTEWEGWGTALKPAHEPIVVARKPLSEPTIAKNVLKWGTGAINIDGCRVGTEESTVRPNNKASIGYGGSDVPFSSGSNQGRFPANFILSYPEDEYILRDDVTPEQLHQLAEWMNENAKY